MTRSMSSPISRVSIFTFSVTTLFRSTILGASICLRLKASSWRVREVARCGGIGDLLRVSAHGGLVADTSQQELGVSRDHHEQVVEVVGDAAGEPADGFHLLGLAKLLLQGAAFGDVFGEEFEENGVASSRKARPERRTLTMVRSLAQPVGGHAMEFFQQAQVVGQAEPLLRIGIQVGQIAADQVRRRKRNPAWQPGPGSRRGECRRSCSGKRRRERG